MIAMLQVCNTAIVFRSMVFQAPRSMAENSSSSDKHEDWSSTPRTTINKSWVQGVCLQSECLGSGSRKIAGACWPAVQLSGKASDSLTDGLRK